MDRPSLVLQVPVERPVFPPNVELLVSLIRQPHTLLFGPDAKKLADTLHSLTEEMKMQLALRIMLDSEPGEPERLCDEYTKYMEMVQQTIAYQNGAM